MGCYEREQEAIANGTGKRGDAARAYFAELDEQTPEEASCLTHRPDYTSTLFAPEHDDIYQEFCRYIDQPQPRYFDTVADPLCIEGWTAPEIYRTMIASNPRIVALDGGAIYSMLVRLRTQPELAKKILDFKPTCYQNGCGNTYRPTVEGQLTVGAERVAPSRGMARVELVPLDPDDREQFILDNQEAFNYGATEEFGLRDDHFEEDGQIIARSVIESSLDHPCAEAYRIVADGEVAGGLVLIIDAEKQEGELDLLFVSPDAHSKGIGQAAWRAVEELHPEIGAWELVTPYFETRNIHFYVNRLGFHIIEFYNERYPDPHETAEHAAAHEGGDDDTGMMFRFRKEMKRS